MIKRVVCLLLTCALLLLCSCSLPFVSSDSVLKIGIGQVEGNFNPFYSSNENDKKIVAQVFESVQRVGEKNRLVNVCGSITYEYLDNKKVKYTVSIRDDMLFSNGTAVTIDDIIFYYYVLADASYDGPYSDWYLNDIEGLKEFYFDDANYAVKLNTIKQKVDNNYTEGNISEDAMYEYLFATQIEGAWAGDLNAQTSPSGKSWKSYIETMGGKDELEQLGDNADSDDYLELIARIESQARPGYYNAEDWWYAKLVDDYLAENYADGVNVEKISGIKKINDYTCTIVFNSHNINAISQINPIIVSKQFYGTGYTKGNASVIKEITTENVGSGPYVLEKFKESEVRLVANENYYDGPVGFENLRFEILNENDDAAAKVISGDIDVAEIAAAAQIVSDLDTAKIKYNSYDENCYHTLYLNAQTLEKQERNAIVQMLDAFGPLEQSIGAYYTAVYRPLSLNFSEYPLEIKEPYYSVNDDKALLYLNTIGCYTENGVMLDKDGEPLVYNAYIAERETSPDFKILQTLADKLSSHGIKLNINSVSLSDLETAVKDNRADIWFASVADGQTCDFYNRYHSTGTDNLVSVNSEEIDSRILEIRNALDFEERSTLVSDLLELIMEETVEMPLYQRKMLTAYNTDTVDQNSIAYAYDPTGFTYILKDLQPC